MNWFFSKSQPSHHYRFDALLRPHLARLYRLAYRFTRSREDAEDLVQSLLLKLIPQEDRLESVEILGPWLARSLYHLYVDQERQRRRAQAALGIPVADDDVIAAIVDEVSESPEQAADRQLTRRRLEAALAALSVEHRALIVWHDMEGFTLEELAATLAVPLGTLKSRLHRGRANLRHSLMEPSAASERVSGERIPT